MTVPLGEWFGIILATLILIGIIKFLVRIVSIFAVALEGTWLVRLAVPALAILFWQKVICEAVWHDVRLLLRRLQWSGFDGVEWLVLATGFFLYFTDRKRPWYWALFLGAYPVSFMLLDRIPVSDVARESFWVSLFLPAVVACGLTMPVHLVYGLLMRLWKANRFFLRGSIQALVAVALLPPFQSFLPRLAEAGAGGPGVLAWVALALWGLGSAYGAAFEYELGETVILRDATEPGSEQPAAEGQQYSQSGQQYAQGGQQYAQGAHPYTQGGYQYTQGGHQYAQGRQQYAQGGQQYAHHQQRPDPAAAQTAQERGLQFERYVLNQLQYLRPAGYEVLSHLWVRGVGTSEIDHVAIGPSGIWVIEAKYRFGAMRLREGQWEFQNGVTGETVPDENPGAQNDRHVIDLRQFLAKHLGRRIEGVAFHNVVCIPDRVLRWEAPMEFPQFRVRTPENLRLEISTAPASGALSQEDIRRLAILLLRETVFVTQGYLERKQVPGPLPQVSRTWHAVLGVSIAATDEDVQRRFLELSKRHHPDSGPEANVERYKAITAAYSELRNHRAEYEERLRHEAESVLRQLQQIRAQYGH